MARTVTPVAGATPTLAWYHNDPAGLDQGDYHVQIVAIGGTAPFNSGTVVVDTGFVAGSDTFYSVPIGALALGSTYKWRVETKNSSGYVSQRTRFRDDGTTWIDTFSDFSYFRTVTQPVPSALPTGTSLNPIPTVTWTYTGSTAQTRYEVSIVTSAGSAVYSTGTVVSSAVLFNFPIDVLTSGGASISYVYTVRVYDSDLITGEASASMIVSYAYPTGATATAAGVTGSGLIRLSAITGGSPVYRRVYRKISGDVSFSLLQDSVSAAVTTVDDKTAAAGQSYDYAISNVTAGLLESVKFSIVNVRVDFPGTWIMSPDAPTLDTFMEVYSPSSRSDAVDQATIQPLDRDATVVELGAVRLRKGRVTGFLPWDDLGTAQSSTTALRSLKSMRGNKLPVWIKGPNPESTVYAVLLNVSESDGFQRGRAGERGYSVEIDYQEVEP